MMYPRMILCSDDIGGTIAKNNALVAVILMTIAFISMDASFYFANPDFFMGTTAVLCDGFAVAITLWLTCSFFFYGRYPIDALWIAFLSVILIAPYTVFFICIQTHATIKYGWAFLCFNDSFVVLINSACYFLLMSFLARKH